MHAAFLKNHLTHDSYWYVPQRYSRELQLLKISLFKGYEHTFTETKHYLRIVQLADDMDPVKFVVCFASHSMQELNSVVALLFL